MPRRQLFTAQPSSSTPAPAASKSNKRTAGEFWSPSPAKNPSNQRETRATAALSSQTANRIPLAAITRNQKSRKQMNHKVQVFEAENSNKRPDTQMDNQRSIIKQILAKIECNDRTTISLYSTIQYPKVKRTSYDASF